MMNIKKLVLSFSLVLSILAAQSIFAGEAERNKKIAEACTVTAKNHTRGNGQTRPMCQQAIYHKCVADDLCGFYPGECSKLKARAPVLCSNLSSMGSNNCPAC